MRALLCLVLPGPTAVPCPAGPVPRRQRHPAVPSPSCKVGPGAPGRSPGLALRPPVERFADGLCTKEGSQ